MDCSLIRTLFIDYYFNELNESNRKEVLTHISECSLCYKEYLDFKTSTEMAFPNSKKIIPSDKLKNSIKNELIQEYKKTTILEWFYFKVPAYKVVLSFALVLFAFFTFSKLKLDYGQNDSNKNQLKVISELYDSGSVDPGNII